MIDSLILLMLYITFLFATAFSIHYEPTEPWFTIVYLSSYFVLGLLNVNRFRANGDVVDYVIGALFIYLGVFLVITHMASLDVKVIAFILSFLVATVLLAYIHFASTTKNAGE